MIHCTSFTRRIHPHKGHKGFLSSAHRHRSSRVRRWINLSSNHRLSGMPTAAISMSVSNQVKKRFSSLNRSSRLIRSRHSWVFDTSLCGKLVDRGSGYKGNTNKIALRNLSIAITTPVVHDIADDDATEASAPIMHRHPHSLHTPLDTRHSPFPTFGPNGSIIHNPDLLLID